MNALWISLPMPALVLNSDDTVADSNPAAESFLNLSAKALLGAAMWDKITFDTPLRDAFGRARAHRTSLFVNHVDIASAARAPVQCNIQFAPLQNGGDQMLMLFTPRDMASRITKSTPAARAARSAIGMAEMLSHEIKNPLAGITGAAQLLSMTLSADDRELTDLIVEESRRIVTLLDRVEQFGNLQPPNLGPVNIHDVLDRARQSASVGFGAHMVLLEDYDPSLPQACADADQLLQVLLNLLKNAAESGQAGGRITLHTFYDPALRLQGTAGPAARLPLQIEVIDDGPGLPPDIAPDVFDPFVSGRTNGTGLGLALVSKLVAGGGGMITVSSVPGRTVFRISLPVMPKPAERSDPIKGGT